MNFPDDLRYTSDHEWIRVEGDGQTAVVGITDYAQSELGDIVFVELEPEGSELSREQAFGTVEAVKTVSELFMPVSGTLAAHNTELERNPELVNEDPYGRGWMVKIAMADPDEVASLLSADAYRELVASR